MGASGTSFREQELEQKLEAAEQEKRRLSERLAALERALLESGAETALAAESLLIRERLLKNMAAFGGTLQESQRTLALMSQSLTRKTEEARETVKTMLACQTVLRKFSADAQRLPDDARTAMAPIRRLNAHAGQIADLIGLTQSAAGQTKRLTSGADEAQADHADVRGISEMMKAVQADADAALAAIERLAEHSGDLGENGRQTAEEMSAATEHAHRIEESMRTAALRGFVELAKFDHLVFKFEVYKVFIGVSEKKAEDLADGFSCRLGKWYYRGEGRENCSQMDGYAAMEMPHHTVHRYGKEALEAFHDGRFTDGVAAIETMEDASHGVLNCLERILQAAET